MEDPEDAVRRLTEELEEIEAPLTENMDESTAESNVGEAASPEPVADRPEGDIAVLAEEGPRAEAEQTIVAEPPAAATEPPTPAAAAATEPPTPAAGTEPPTPLNAKGATSDPRPSIAASVDAQVIKDRKSAVEEAKLYAADRQPRVLAKPGKPAYEKLVGEKYPLGCPVFHPEKPCLADLGIGTSLYFNTLNKLMLVFFLMFLLGIPSLTITFIANPNAASDAAEPPNSALASLSVFTVAGMFKQNTEQQYGCTADNCTLANNQTVSTEMLAAAIVWMDLFSCLVFLISIPFIIDGFERRAAAVDEHNVTASDYSVWVWGVPPNCTQEQVKAHFDKYDGSICPPKSASNKVVPHPGGDQPAPAAAAPDEEAPNERPADAEGGEEGAAVIAVQAMPISAADEAQAEVAVSAAADEEAVPAPEPASAALPAEDAPDVAEDALKEVEELAGDGGEGAGAAEGEAVSGAAFGLVPGDVEATGAGGAEPVGGVADVFLARADASVFKLLEDRNEEQKEIGQLAAAMQELESEKKRAKVQKKMDKLQAKLDKVRDKIHKISAKGGTDEGHNPVVCAFVMFNTQVAQLDCLRHYQSKEARQGGVLCRKQHPQFHLKAEGEETGRPLRVVDAPEPSTLLWENLECGARSRAIRRVLSSCCSFLIILISFGVIVAGKSYSLAMKGAEELCITPGYVESCNSAFNWKAEVDHACPNGQDSCQLWEAWGLNPYWRVEVTPMDLDDYLYPPTTYTLIGHECRMVEDNTGVYALDKTVLSPECLAQAAVNSSHWLALINAGWRDPGFENKSDCVLCLCSALQQSANLLWLETWDFQLKSATLRSDDDEAFCTPQAEAFFTFVGLQGAAIVIVVLFNTVMKTTTQLLAVFERHHTLDDQETSVTFAVFIGQFINTALVAMIVYGNIPLVGDNVPSAFPILAGEFEDFTSGWYFLVGVQIMTTIIVNVVLPIVPLVTEVLLKLLLPITARGIVLQTELNNAYLGSDFLLSTRYGMLLNSMFTCFMYSSGMPILLLIGIFIFFVTYWVDKIQLLRVSSSPPQYDATLAIYVVKKFKWAILIHMLVGCWVFSATDTLGKDQATMFPRPVLSEALEDYSAKLIEEAFGCQQFTEEDLCNAESSCFWGVDIDAEGDGLEAACLVDKSSDEYEDYANFDFIPRLFNRVVFPYFFFTFLFLVHTILQFTPARFAVNLATSTLFGAIKMLVSLVAKTLCGKKVAADDDSKVEGDHGMAPYKDAVQDGAFGTFDHNYDVSLIGQYEKTLAVGDSLFIYRQVSPYQPLLDVQPPTTSKARPASAEPR